MMARGVDIFVVEFFPWSLLFYATVAFAARVSRVRTYYGLFACPCFLACMVFHTRFFQFFGAVSPRLDFFRRCLRRAGGTSAVHSTNPPCLLGGEPCAASAAVDMLETRHCCYCCIAHEFEKSRVSLPAEDYHSFRPPRKCVARVVLACKLGGNGVGPRRGFLRGSSI